MKIWESRFLVAGKVTGITVTLGLTAPLFPSATRSHETKLLAKSLRGNPHDRLTATKQCGDGSRPWSGAVREVAPDVMDASHIPGSSMPHCVAACNQHVGNLESIGSSNQGCCRFGAQIVRSHATLLNSICNFASFHVFRRFCSHGGDRFRARFE